MAAPVGLILGNIQFLQREVPDNINFGGKQMLAIHRNLGGFRTIDAMGPDPASIHWSGHFYSTPQIPGTAAIRARTIDNLRKSGAEVWLYWGTFAYLVTVASFDAVYKNEWEIAYKISCVVVQDATQTNNQLPTTLNQAVNTDINSINNIASASPATPAVSGAITPAMTASLANAQSALLNAAGTGTIDSLSLPQLQPIIAAFNDAFNIFAAGTGMPQGINLDAESGASILDGIGNFQIEADNVAMQSDQQIALAYLGRIVSNLTAATG